MFFNVQISIFNKSCKGRYDYDHHQRDAKRREFQFLIGTIRLGFQKGLRCFQCTSFNSLQVRYDIRQGNYGEIHKEDVSIPQRYDTTLKQAILFELASEGFNSSKVRYDSQENRAIYRDRFCFNSSKVRYDSSQFITYSDGLSIVSIPQRYDTTEETYYVYFYRNSFNSSKVRYDRLVLWRQGNSSKFQFLKGTIRPGLNPTDGENADGFNSSKVRYDEAHFKRIK